MLWERGMLLLAGMILVGCAGPGSAAFAPSETNQQAIKLIVLDADGDDQRYALYKWRADGRFFFGGGRQAHEGETPSELPFPKDVRHTLTKVIEDIGWLDADQVMPLPPHDQITVMGRDHHIIADPALQRVTPCATFQIIVALVPDHQIIAGIAVHTVIASAAVHPVIARTARKPVVKAAAAQIVVPFAAVNRVAVMSAVNHIIARAAGNIVTAATGKDHLIARGANHLISLVHRFEDRAIHGRDLGTA